MKNRKIWKLVTAMVVTGALLFSAVGIPFAMAAQSADDLQGQVAALEKQIQKYNAELERIRSERDDQDAYIAKLNEQLKPLNEKVNLMQKSVDELTGQIDTLSAQIDQLQQQIDAQQIEVQAKKEKLSERLRTMYMNGGVSALELMLDTKGFSEYLAVLEVFNRSNNNDNKLLEELKQEIASLEENGRKLTGDKEELVAKQTEQQAQLDQLKADQAKAQAAVDEVQAYIGKLDANDARVAKIVNDQEAQKDALESAVQQMLAEKGSHGDGSINSAEGASTRLAYPIPDYPLGSKKGYVSSSFGPRTNPYTGYHRGIDLSGGGVRGARIVAAEAGKVIDRYYESGGYGNVVYIDHGNGVVTRYAHCNDIIVSVGQTVQRGQTIGHVGNTGLSTGPHLHFEVRINGNPVDPYSYIT